VRLVWVVIPLVLIGIIGIQSVDARYFDDKYYFPNYIFVKDLDGNNMDTVIVGTQYTLKLFYPMEVDLLCYFGINVPLSLCPDHEFPVVIGDKLFEKPPEIEYTHIIQIKDDQGFVNDLIFTSGVATDISTDIEISWIPKKSGTYTIENFIWSSLDNPVIVTVPSFLSVIVEESSHYDNVDFSKTIVDDKPLDHIVLAGIPVALYSSLEYPEFIKMGDEFDVTVKWTFTEYDEEGNIEHQYSPINSLTKEIFDKAFLQIKIPKNIETITDVSDWEETVKVYHDTSYNFNSTFTSYAKTVPFDYTNAMHEQTYRFKLTEPFFPPFDRMTFGGLGFSKTIFHQDGSLLHQFDTESINTLQSAITVEKLGSVDPQYPDVPRSEVNWERASDIVPTAINTLSDPDENQTQDIRDFYVNVLKRNPTNDELLNTGVSQTWIDNFFEKFPELK